MTETSSPIIGIDLGTTNSVVAVVVDGKPQILDCDGRPSMPSVVGITADDNLITGVVARNQLAAFPDRTIPSIKRKMGTMTPTSLGDQEYTPPEISAMILRRLRDVASRALGKDVSRAVITVPAYFDEHQRQATREAGELAGLTVERIINEPTAATLVYHANSQDKKHIAVYDFGGGTFDVSVVRMEAGVIEVLTSQGDTSLGGDDLDQILLDYVAEEFIDEHEIDLRENPQSRYRVLQACEQAKVRLTELESTDIAEEFIIEKDSQPLNLNVTIDRKTMNELVEPFVDRTIECVSKAIQDASLTIHQIDDLVLVGGSTRLTLVAEKLRAEFLKEPSRAVDPDLAVALGASVQAAMLEGQIVGDVLVDVATHTLGIEVAGSVSMFGSSTTFAPIIHRNSPLPVRHEEAFSKVHDEQVAAEIHVLQGEHHNPSRNTSIGKFKIDLESNEGNHQKIVVGFDLTLDGILRVTATQPATGQSEELTIDNALTQISEEARDRATSRLNEMFENSSELLDQDELQPKTELKAQQAEVQSTSEQSQQSLLEQFPETASLLEKAKELQGTTNEEDAEELQMLQEQLEIAIEKADIESIKLLTTDLDDLLFYVH